ncbi:MAG TPA: hypothetical protein PLD20_24925 [Blastocatellia bacterium]|nr:hypothetical protein [Blastocatellia bacterium]HMY70628.1 hypothetical protein [Blastocatellia bacterium]HMZ21202.1 hypothetical protein [Blastocatellia bacterium]HNG34313.1 hypothetical protein [Blastocatellia bacterium]
MTHILQGQAVAMFAFDVGYEVSLERLSAMMATTPVQPLSRKKQTPTYLQYSRPPQILHLGIATGHFPAPGNILATIFDFGAVSISYRWNLTQTEPLALDELPQLSHDLYQLNLEIHAREQVESLMRKIEPAIIRPALAELMEDYYLFIFEKLDKPLTAEELVANHRQTLAQTLRFETTKLSRAQQAEALAQSISYYEHDVTLVDWNAAVIYDPDYEDTANVLELLNVELLEARYVDRRLDKSINEYAGLVRKRIEWPIPLRTPYRKAIEDLAELRLESALLSERVENALKLVGDLFLARLHTAAAQRFYLQEWDIIISRKLEIISDFYDLLSDRLHTVQSQTLELIVILLILVEVMLPFIGRH